MRNGHFTSVETTSALPHHLDSLPLTDVTLPLALEGSQQFCRDPPRCLSDSLLRLSVDGWEMKPAVPVPSPAQHCSERWRGQTIAWHLTVTALCSWKVENWVISSHVIAQFSGFQPTGESCSIGPMLQRGGNRLFLFTQNYSFKKKKKCRMFLPNTFFVLLCVGNGQ